MADVKEITLDFRSNRFIGGSAILFCSKRKVPLWILLRPGWSVKCQSLRGLNTNIKVFQRSFKTVLVPLLLSKAVSVSPPLICLRTVPVWGVECQASLSLISLRVFRAKRHCIWLYRSLLGLHAKNSFYLHDSCNQSLKWSLLGVKKRLGHAQIGLL